MLIGYGFIDEGIACYVFGLSLKDLIGTYALKDFNVVFDDGPVITRKDFFSFSGTMHITASGYMYQLIELNGIEFEAGATILDVKSNYIRISSAGCTFDLGIDLSDRILITYLPTGTCGEDGSETDVWEKISESSSLDYRNSISREKYDQNIFAIPGGSVGTFYNTLP